MSHWFLNSASQLVLTQLARPCTPTNRSQWLTRISTQAPVIVTAP